MTRATRPAKRPSKLVPAILLAAMAAVGFILLTIRLEITKEGYQLSALRTRIAMLEENNRTLRLKVAELSSHQRLRKLARRYHLVPPAAGQVVMIP